MLSSFLILFHLLSWYILFFSVNFFFFVFAVRHTVYTSFPQRWVVPICFYVFLSFVFMFFFSVLLCLFLFCRLCFLDFVFFLSCYLCAAFFFLMILLQLRFTLFSVPSLYSTLVRSLTGLLAYIVCRPLLGPP